MLRNPLNTIKPWLRKVLAILYLVLVVLLSLLPTSDFPDIPYFTGEDKGIHFCMYFGLGFMACWSLEMSSRRVTSYLPLLGGVFLWGVIMEILQQLMAYGRSMDILDMAANLAGALAGLFAYLYLLRISKGDSLRV